MFGRQKPQLREGANVFLAEPADGYKKFVFGMITGIDGNQVGINGLIVDPVGLRNKVEQGKAGKRSHEILQNPTPENCIFALIYRIEHDNYTRVVDSSVDKPEIISPRVYAVLDGWVRESLPELLNNVLSLAPGDERDAAKRVLKSRMETLLDKNLRRNLYSICRSLKILN